MEENAINEAGEALKETLRLESVKVEDDVATALYVAVSLWAGKGNPDGDAAEELYAKADRLKELRDLLDVAAEMLVAEAQTFS